MTKRDKTQESEFERQLETNSGKIAIFRYETPSRDMNRIVTSRLVIGKIGKFERDFTNSNYGHFVYIGKIDGELKNKILIGLANSDAVFNKSEKPKNYQERYHIRRMSELEVLN